MTTVVLAAPSAPPPPPVPRWPGLSVTWEGWDGSLWDLRDYRRGVFMLPDVDGLHFPPFKQITRERLRGGQRLRRAVPQPRPVEFTVLIHVDSSNAWVNLNDAWWDSFHPERPGTLRIGTPDGSIRSIRLRLDPSGDFSYPRDPTTIGWVAYPVSLIADDPAWMGEPVTDRWEQEGDQPDFFPEDGGPPFNVASDARLEGAAMHNPGDEPAWVTWRVTAGDGGIASMTVTVAGGTFMLPSIAAGLTVVTDTGRGTTFRGTWDEETNQLVDPVEISGLVNPWRPRPIPDKTTSPVGFSMLGFGTVDASLTPRYWRAIGKRHASQ